MKNKLIALLIMIPFCAHADLQSDLKLTKGFHIVKNNVITKSAINNNGFTESNDADNTIQFFLSMKERAPAEIKEFSKKDNSDTHLKKSFTEIKLSIPFKKLNSISDADIIGYAPIGSYDEGWTGIRVFFEKPSLGICSYSFEKFIGIEADSDSVKYLVNGKPSFTSIDGNYNTGFLYTLSWNVDNKDSAYDSKLECVNKNYNATIMDKMIKLASQIDK